MKQAVLKIIDKTARRACPFPPEVRAQAEMLQKPSTT